MNVCIRVAALFGIFVVQGCVAERTGKPTESSLFDPSLDLLSLHYDHAPDLDDGHSSAADLTILESMFPTDWIRSHVIPVSGVYGENADIFNPDSDAVMDSTWSDLGGWLAADDDWDGVVEVLVARWGQTLQGGGDIWVKEGGQSDLVAHVVRGLQFQFPSVDMGLRVHVVQHSDWNEDKTTDSELAFVQGATHYIRIRDANDYLNIPGGDSDFVRAAKDHPTFGRAWRAAFEYYDPEIRLDFSDTGELMHILGLGEMGIPEFLEKYLGS